MLHAYQRIYKPAHNYLTKKKKNIIFSIYLVYTKPVNSAFLLILIGCSESEQLKKKNKIKETMYINCISLLLTKSTKNY